MEKRVETVKEFVAVKRITGVDDDGRVQIELVDGTMIAMTYIKEYPVFIYPAYTYGHAVFNGAVLKGFEIER